MKKLNTIQKRKKLNYVYKLGEEGPGGAFHDYGVLLAENHRSAEQEPMVLIEFQRGPRNDPNSRPGVLEVDLLEIVRDRLKGFQSGPLACRENACALTHIEEALMWMNKRTEERIEQGILGTMEETRKDI